MFMDKEEIYVNGPTNFFRLKNNEKEIYIFYDYHINITHQTECENEHSINIDKYFLHFYKNNTEMVDFFLEIETKPLDVEDSNYNWIYLNKIRNLFAKFYNKNKNYEHLRLHYIDIRLDTLLWFPYKTNDYLTNQGLYNLKYVIYDLKLYYKNYEVILSYIKKYLYNKDDTPNKEDFLDTIFHKIMTRYYDKKIFENIINFFNEYILKKINFVMKLLLEYIENFENIYLKYKKYFTHDYLFFVNIGDNNTTRTISSYKYPKEYYNDFKIVEKQMDYLISIMIDISSYIMDCYFLRRFLDKNYIKKAISYTGLAHSSNYLWFLVKYCDFKIIEYGFINNVDNAIDFEKIIKNMESVYDIYEYVESQPIKQCSKIRPLFS